MILTVVIDSIIFIIIISLIGSQSKNINCLNMTNEMVIFQRVVVYDHENIVETLSEKY